MNRKHVLRTTVLSLSLSCLGLSLVPSLAAAKDAVFPAQMTILVPYPAGSSNDTFARLLARKLAPALGINVIVQNKPGASGNIGANFVAKSAPNGATLLLTSSSFTTSAAIDPNLPFDPIADLLPVAQLAQGPLFIAVNAQSPYKTLPQLLKAAGAKQGAINFGTSGVGSLSHLANELMNSMAKVEMTHVPYKGISEAITDLSGGRIDMVISSIPGVAPQIKGGTVRGIAVTSPEASAFAPGVPTVASTIPGYSAEIWWGLFAPRGTPDEIMERLNAETRTIVAQPEMRDRFAQEGAAPSQLSVSEFAKVVKADVAQWRGVAKERGIKPE